MFCCIKFIKGFTQIFGLLNHILEIRIPLQKLRRYHSLLHTLLSPTLHKWSTCPKGWL